MLSQNVAVASHGVTSGGPVALSRLSRFRAPPAMSLRTPGGYLRSPQPWQCPAKNNLLGHDISEGWWSLQDLWDMF